MDANSLMFWKLHAKSKIYRRNIGHSKEIIYNAFKCGKCCISWSAGKDSTAMTHLIKSIYPDIPIIIQFDDCDWPEKREYVDHVSKSQGWNFHAVEPGFSIWEKAQKFNIGTDDICSQSHQITREGFLKPLTDKQKELGCNVIFVGLRAEESIKRKINYLTKGELYQLKTKEWHCCPLSRWSINDVFSYHIKNDIEINPCYFYNRFFKPEDIRISWALPTPVNIRKGELEHMKFYYPEQFRKLRKMGLA